MFNRTLNVIQQPRGPSHVSVTTHEHRAPTDDSIRLAGEYEQKAWAKVKDAVLHDIPGLDAQALLVEHNYALREVSLIFKLNGQSIEAKVNVNGFDTDPLKACADAIAAAVAKFIVAKAVMARAIRP